MKQSLYPALKLVAATCAALACHGAYALESWSAAGSSGVLDESATAVARLNNPALNHKPGSVGTIVARYPIIDVFTDPANPTPKWLGVGYTDSGANSQVLIRLYQENYITGVLTLLQTWDSNVFTQSNQYQFRWLTNCSLNLNFFDNNYYIEATISRTVDNTGVGLRQVRMDNYPCVTATGEAVQRAGNTPD